MSARSYRDLEVWRRAVDLVVLTYELSRTFPRDEMFGLTSQMRRAAVSVPANIAEGQGRLHRREFLQHASIARGSLSEFETHCEIARRLGYIDDGNDERLWECSQEVARLLNGLIRHLRADD